MTFIFFIIYAAFITLAFSALYYIAQQTALFSCIYTVMDILPSDVIYVWYFIYIIFLCFPIILYFTKLKKKSLIIGAAGAICVFVAAFFAELGLSQNFGNSNFDTELWNNYPYTRYLMKDGIERKYKDKSTAADVKKDLGNSTYTYYYDNQYELEYLLKQYYGQEIFLTVACRKEDDKVIAVDLMYPSDETVKNTGDNSGAEKDFLFSKIFNHKARDLK